MHPSLPDRWRAYAHRLLTTSVATLGGPPASERIAAFIDARAHELASLVGDDAEHAAERVALWSHRVTAELLAFLGSELEAWRRPVRPPRILVLDGEVELTAREYLVFQAFTQHRGQVLTRCQLRALAWSDDVHVKENVVTVYVGYLRRKLGRDAIETVRGAGYRMR